MPKNSNTSAEPDLLEAERLPCFAIVTPAPAATIAAAVEMLKVLSLSPPVPQVSTAFGNNCGRRTAPFFIAVTKPDISFSVSPLILNATATAAI